MTLAPLFAASAVIQLHVVAALLSVLAGSIVLVLRKGTRPHWVLGWGFAVTMGTVAVSSLFIGRNGHFSAIHLLTLLTLVSLPYAIVMRRRGNIAAHKKAMISLFCSLVIAGAFTLIPAG